MTAQANLFALARRNTRKVENEKARQIAGFPGQVLRIFDRRHQAALEGKRYMMHGGDLVAAQRLEAAGYKENHLEDLMLMYFDRLEEVRGTDDARWWPARFTAFTSRIADLITMTDPVTHRPLTYHEASAINRAGFRGYLAGSKGERRSTNPHDAGTRTWARWDKGHQTGSHAARPQKG